MRMVLAAALLAAIASPALSAEFYIVQDTASKRCQGPNRCETHHSDASDRRRQGIRHPRRG